MKKKTKILLCVFLALTVLGVLWYKMPVRLTTLSPEDVSEIYVFGGMNGKELHITGQEEIGHIIETMRTVKLQKNGVSLFRMGYQLKLTIVRKDGTAGRGMDAFIINGQTVRRDPFFYKIVEGSLDDSYIRDLMETESRYPEGAGVLAADAVNWKEESGSGEGIPFRYLHRGFTAIRLEDQKSFGAFCSIGTKIILAEEDWSDYMARFCPGIPCFGSVDFSGECLVASVVLGARPAYIQAGTLIGLKAEEGHFVFEYDDDPTSCLALNTDGTTHFYVEVLIINREDLPEGMENLVYHGDPVD